MPGFPLDGHTYIRDPKVLSIVEAKFVNFNFLAFLHVSDVELPTSYSLESTVSVVPPFFNHLKISSLV